MKRVAVLIEDLFDEKELIYPYYRLKEEGYKVDLIGTEKGKAYKSKSGLMIKSDLASKEVNSQDYDAVVIPGGFSPDYMRRSVATVDFVSNMNKDKKTIAAICHGPWLLISSCDIKALNMTSYHSIKDDIINAGGVYKDEEVVVSGNIISSRTPDDLPAFLKAIIKSIEN